MIRDQMKKRIRQLVRGKIPQFCRSRYQRTKFNFVFSSRNAEEKLSECVRESGRVVFLSSDLKAFISNRRARRSTIELLVRRGTLVQLAPDIYAKARKSSITGKSVPAGSPERIIREVANQAGLRVCESRSQRAYNEGRSTQVPTGRRVVVEGKPNICVSKLQIGNGVFEFVRE